MHYSYRAYRHLLFPALPLLFFLSFHQYIYVLLTTVPLPSFNYYRIFTVIVLLFLSHFKVCIYRYYFPVLHHHFVHLLLTVSNHLFIHTLLFGRVVRIAGPWFSIVILQSPHYHDRRSCGINDNNGTALVRQRPGLKVLTTSILCF